jgi:hypothetical protein
MNNICIGCGCTDERACASGCSWVRVDPEARIGVCSSCIRDVARWDAGERSVSDYAHEKRTGRCRSCNARVIWFKTALGKNMPVDEGTVEQNDVILDMKRHISHFATCPNRDQHRRPR